MSSLIKFKPADENKSMWCQASVVWWWCRTLVLKELLTVSHRSHTFHCFSTRYSLLLETHWPVLYYLVLWWLGSQSTIKSISGHFESFVILQFFVGDWNLVTPYCFLYFVALPVYVWMHHQLGWEPWWIRKPRKQLSGLYLQRYTVARLTACPG